MELRHLRSVARTASVNCSVVRVAGVKGERDRLLFGECAPRRSLQPHFFGVESGARERDEFIARLNDEWRVAFSIARQFAVELLTRQ